MLPALGSRPAARLARDGGISVATDHRMRLSAVVVLGVLVAATGCTTGGQTSAVVDDGGMAAVAPDLAGTWRGTAFAVPGSSHLTSTGVELEITPGGSWAWKSGGATKASGTVFRRGDRVLLQAGPSSGLSGATADVIPLQQRGDHLWGVSRYFIPGAQSAVDLQRQHPASDRREPHS
jgi:hypothetical protein